MLKEAGRRGAGLGWAARAGGELAEAALWGRRGRWGSVGAVGSAGAVGIGGG
jgi:hypothetical protein